MVYYCDYISHVEGHSGVQFRTNTAMGVCYGNDYGIPIGTTTAGASQMRKLSLITAVVACVVLPSVALATHGGHHGGGGHGGGHWAGSTSGPIGGGLHGHGAGHGRYWHGLWYEEGVGHCWRLTPDGYVWACD
jgi:hypothetical protein